MNRKRTEVEINIENGGVQMKQKMQKRNFPNPGFQPLWYSEEQDC